MDEPKMTARAPFIRPLAAVLATMLMAAPASAASPDTIAAGLAPHRAVYDIRLSATHSGSQILNISGQMTYEWKPSCDGYVTDHRFKMNYEYADAPGMRVSSDFSTYETKDGRIFDYASRRKRDGEMYQQIRGQATLGANGGKVLYSAPEKLKYDLKKGALFPAGHSIELIRRAQDGARFFSAEVFDGSDEDGPIEINAFIGKQVDPAKMIAASDKIDSALLKSPAWSMRMAVFPVKDQEEVSDYEMSLLFQENGIISDMTIEYDDFTVRQTLVGLEKIATDSCGDADGSQP